MPPVELPRTLAVTLLHEAQRNPDREVCGLVAARDAQPVRVIPVRNASGNPRALFEMDERELVDAFRTMRENGEDLFAIYHSHPDSAPVPSSTDIRRSAYPDALHLIISLEVKGVLQMRGWRLDGATSEPVEIIISEEH